MPVIVGMSDNTCNMFYILQWRMLIWAVLGHNLTSIKTKSIVYQVIFNVLALPYISAGTRENHGDTSSERRLDFV